MERQELKREIIRMYANCGSYILTLENREKNGCYITSFAHPTCDKIIEVTETLTDIKCVFVYERSDNAMQRNAVECKTIDDFRRAVA